MPFSNKIEPVAAGSLKLHVPGHVLYVPELPFGIWKSLEKSDIALLSSDSTDPEVRQETMFRIAHRALQVHYPDCTLQDVKDTLNLRQLRDAVSKAIVFGDADPTPAATSAA